MADIPASGNGTLANQSYQWQDDLSTESAGSISYRIRQVVDTATDSYADLFIGDPIVITHQATCSNYTTNSIRLAPNPVSASSVSVIFNTVAAITQINFLIYDMKGSLILQTTGAKAAGFYRKEINVNALVPGKYFVRVLDGQSPLVTLELLKL